METLNTYHRKKKKKTKKVRYEKYDLTLTFIFGEMSFNSLIWNKLKRNESSFQVASTICNWILKIPGFFPQNINQPPDLSKITSPFQIYFFTYWLVKLGDQEIFSPTKQNIANFKMLMILTCLLASEIWKYQSSILSRCYTGFFKSQHGCQESKFNAQK